VKTLGILLSIITVSVLAVCPSAYALKMNIDPPRVELTVKGGEETSGFINVMNYDEEGTIHVKVYVQDVMLLPDGSNDFLPLGSTPWSIAEYLKIGPTEFDLEPGKSTMVRYIVSPTADIKGGIYGVVFFEVATPPSQFMQVGANVNVRLGSVFLVSIEGTEVKMVKLTDISITEPKDGAPLQISCTVFNEGNVLSRPSGTVKIIDSDEVLVDEIPVNTDKGGVFPNTNRKFTVTYKKELKEGEYTAQLVLDYGGDVLIGGQKKFSIK